MDGELAELNDHLKLAPVVKLTVQHGKPLITDPAAVFHHLPFLIIKQILVKDCER
jgi:hypothetical protein